ncbi:hypothetical protein MP228_006316 [Amoeboaphelidium protococcarum]|nr:hypothetical protein MP228_006316 [Amoeboaphelidium protococcarum]
MDSRRREALEHGLCKYYNKIDKFAQMLKDVNYPGLVKFASQQLKDKARSVLQKMVKDSHLMEQMGGWIHAGISGRAFTLDPRSPERHRELINDFCNKRQQFIAKHYNPSPPAVQANNVKSNLMATQAKDQVNSPQLREIHELKSLAQILVPQTSPFPSGSGRALIRLTSSKQLSDMAVFGRITKESQIVLLKLE